MKNSDSVKKKLQDAIHKLGDATRNKDWAALKALDSEAHQAIEAALKTGSAPSEEIRRMLEELQILYQEMISACRLERDHIQGQVIASKRRQEAIDRYHHASIPNRSTSS